MTDKIPDRQRCEKIAAILKTLSHPQRLYILCKLYRKDMTVSELEKSCSASQPLISQHLTRMRLEGIVDSRREGNFVYYSIIDPQMGELLKAFEKVFGK